MSNVLCINLHLNYCSSSVLITLLCQRNAYNTNSIIWREYFCRRPQIRKYSDICSMMLKSLYGWSKHQPSQMTSFMGFQANL